MGGRERGEKIFLKIAFVIVQYECCKANTYVLFVDVTTTLKYKNNMKNPGKTIMLLKPVLPVTGVCGRRKKIFANAIKKIINVFLCS